MEQVINEVKAAEILGVAVQTMRNWRHQGKPPAYVKLSRCVRYKIEDLKDYINSKRIDPERTV